MKKALFACTALLVTAVQAQEPESYALEEITVTAGKPVTAPISKRPPLLPRPPQPPGREPLHECESQTSRGRKKVSLDEGASVLVEGDESSASSPVSG